MKFEIGYKNKTYHYESEADAMIGKKLGEKFKGEELSNDFAGYEFMITGASDKSGFPAKKELEGTGRRRLLLKRGFSMRKKGEGLVLRKTIRGNTIASDIIQVNLKVVKEGSKSIPKILGKEEKVEEVKGKGDKESKATESAEKEEPKQLTEKKEEKAEKKKEKKEEKK